MSITACNFTRLIATKLILLDHHHDFMLALSWHSWCFNLMNMQWCNIAYYDEHYTELYWIFNLIALMWCVCTILRVGQLSCCWHVIYDDNNLSDFNLVFFLNEHHCEKRWRATTINHEYWFILPLLFMWRSIDVNWNDNRKKYHRLTDFTFIPLESFFLFFALHLARMLMTWSIFQFNKLSVTQLRKKKFFLYSHSIENRHHRFLIFKRAFSRSFHGI